MIYISPTSAALQAQARKMLYKKNSLTTLMNEKSFFCRFASDISFNDNVFRLNVYQLKEKR